MTQDELWLKKYQEVKDFIETNYRNSSRHTPEERSSTATGSSITKKLLNAGEMKEDRVALFKNLLEMGEKYRRKNQITQVILDNLTAQAKASPRLRMNMDLRNSASDSSQRMLNAIEPGSPLPIHRHRKTSETVVCLRGRLVWEFYDGPVCTERVELRRTARCWR